MRLGIETGEHGLVGLRSDLQLLLLAVQEHGPVAVTATVPIAHSTYLARRARCAVGCPRTCSSNSQVLVTRNPCAIITACVAASSAKVDRSQGLG